ncbi:MAG: DNA polymerase III subunit delta' [Flavobacteriaceae bacterium]
MSLAEPIHGPALIGQEAAEEELARAISSGRLHHGWILAGPSGIGKATLAYRAARYLLAYGAGKAEAETLDADPAHPACRQINAGAHPGLLTLAPPQPEPGRRAGLIPVEQVRKVGRFLGATSGEGGWRIVVIDPADGLNRAGQNAILKLLEEPPRQSLFLIVAHQPGRLLPTIRSRCRILELEPLSESAVRRILTEAGFEAGDKLDLAVRFANGDVERAAQIAGGEYDDALPALADVIDTLPAVDTEKAMALAGMTGGAGGEVLFEIVTEALCGWLRATVRGAAEGAAAAALAPYPALWGRITERAGETRGYNLDRSHCVLANLFDIQDALAPGRQR